MAIGVIHNTNGVRPCTRRSATNGPRNRACALKEMATPNHPSIGSVRLETALATAMTQAADQIASHCPKFAAFTATLGKSGSHSHESSRASLPAGRINCRAASASSTVPATDSDFIKLTLDITTTSGLMSAKRYRYGGV